MKKLLCRLGLHKWIVARTVNPQGHYMIQVSEDKVCKRCSKHVFDTSVYDLRKLTA